MAAGKCIVAVLCGVKAAARREVLSRKVVSSAERRRWRVARASRHAGRPKDMKSFRVLCKVKGFIERELTMLRNGKNEGWYRPVPTPHFLEDEDQ